MNLTKVEILDSGSMRIDDPLVLRSRDILPKIGEKSSIFINIIDDRSIIEFLDTNLRININSRYDYIQAILLTLTRTAINKLNDTISVNFLTLPMHKSLNESNGFNGSTTNFFHPARPYYDYMPMSGQFIFKPTAKIATFLFKIMPNDEHYFNNFNKFVKIILLNIEKCDGCQLGLNNQAEIYLNYISYPFRNLLKWSSIYSSVDTVRREIYLQEPFFVLNNISNVWIHADRFCLTSQTKFPIKVDVELIRVDGRMSEQFKVKIGMNSLFFPRLSSSACIDLGINFANDQNQTFYCFNLRGAYTLNLTTRYIINRNLSLFSPVVSVDSFTLNLINKNCSRVGFDQSNLNKYGYQDALLTSLNEISDNITRVQIKLNTNLNYTINIPINILNNMANFTSFEVNYLVEIDTNLERCIHFINADNSNSYRLIDKRRLLLNNKRISQYSVAANLYFPNSTSNDKAFLKFNLINLNQLTQFYMLNVNISLIQNIKDNCLRQYDLDPIFSNLSIYFILRPPGIDNDSRICGIVSLNKTHSRFSYLNSKRQLILFFNNEISTNRTGPTASTRNCLINVLYQIKSMNDVDIFEYLDEAANNFLYLFSTKLNRNLKGNISFF